MFKKYFWLCSTLSFISGLILGYYIEVLGEVEPVFYFVFALILFLFLLRLKNLKFLALFFIFLGLWRYSLMASIDLSGRIESYLNQELKIFGKIITETEIKNGKQKIKLKIFYGQDEKGNHFKLKGRILLSTLSSPVYNYGDFIEVNGKYISPGIIGNFDYGLYLKRFNITAVSYYPQIKKIESQFISNNFRFFHLWFLLRNNIYNFKKKLSNKFDLYLSHNSSAILKAMLLGDKSFLNTEMRDNFSKSGLSHIIAISGMHITLLSSLFLSLSLALGFSRRQSFYLSIFFLIFYLILIGAPASACRASIMGFLSFLALYFGRPGNLLNVLFLSALVLLFINPLLVFGDIGFQLSFLAVLGIIYLNNPVKDFLFLKFFKRFPVGGAVFDILSITISVQLITLPILISSFGQVSVIAPLCNLLVVWLLPIIISLAIIASFLGFIFSFLGFFVYFLIDIILRYIVFVSSVVNFVPGSFVLVNNWSFFWSIIYYLLLFFIFRKSLFPKRFKK